MKTKVRILSLIMMFALLTCCAQPAFAAENTNDSYWIEGEYIVDSEGNKYSQFCDASGEPVDIEVVLEMFNTEVNYDISEADTYALVPNFTTVEVTSVNQNYLGTPVKMTPDAKGPCQLSYSLSSSVSYSITGSFTASVELLILDAVQLECGIQLTRQTTSTDTVEVNYTVSSGKIGAVYFRPYYIRAVGQCVESSGVTKAYTVYYPKILNNNYADGLFYLQES